MKKSLLPFIIFFTLICTAYKASAANANLTGLTISAGSLTFVAATHTYTIKESDVTTSVTVKPTLAGGTITVNGVSVTSGNNSQSISLTPGTNTINIDVTKSGFTPVTYVLTLTSEDINYAGSPFSYYVNAPIATAAPTEIGDTNPTYTATLPAGLTISNTTGNITGTPTAVSAAANYTVTASYGGGITATAQINIAVIPPTISYAGSPFTYYRGSPITTASSTEVGGNPTSYTGTLPAGLLLNASTGDITGTPTTLSAATNYTITAHYTGGITNTTNVNIQVIAPTLSYAGSPYTFSTYQPIPTLTPIVTGTPASYSVGPALPAGLSLNTVTGAITGTPTAITAVSTYTITANYAGGVTAIFPAVITVNLGPPIISYTPSANVYTTGQAITNLVPVNAGGVTTAYAIGPALPPGLSFNNTTGVISGTPTVTSPATVYNISATNFGGVSMTTVTITVNPPLPVISYTPSTVVYTVGTAITPLTPTSTGGPVASYSVGPALPSGLTLNTTTGVISGTPTVAVAAANYTITATNAAGSVTATVNMTVLPLPPVITYTPSTNVYTVGTAIAALAPVVTGGAATSFIIGPSLPPGLSFNTTTGVITGTPLGVSPVTTYTISAENAGGIGTTTIKLSCVNPMPPAISYTPNNPVYTVGTDIGTLSPVNTGGAATSYSINTPLPDGLLFNTTTGAITGNPTTVTASAPYIITATNSVGTGTATINITVNPAAPNITYNPLSYTFTKGTPISPITPISSGGAVASYSISGALPAGLSFNTSTGIISGTPTVTSFTGNVIITGTNVSGSSSVQVTITVNNLGPTITYSPAINIFPVGAAITPLVPTSSGGVPSSYAITSGTLPAGLSFDTSTGIISGTPTTETATPVSIIVKATNAVGSNNSNTIQITVSPHAPVISYTPSTNVYAVNVPIATLTPANTGGAVTGFSYSATGTSIPGGTLRGPSLMTTDAAGNIYVTNYSNGTISKYNSSGTYMGLFEGSFNFNNPCGIVFDSAGNAYVMDTGNGAVYKFGPTGTYIGAIVTSLGHPLGIAIDASDNFYIATYNTGSNVSSVTKYSPTGATLLTLPTTGMNQADGVAIDASGNIYVLNRATNFSTPNTLGNVTEYSPSGAYIGVFSSGYNDPLAISIDAGGDVFVADSHANKIHVYNSSGGLLNTLSGFTDVEGFVADANGNLYVSDFTNNTLKRFDAQGGYHINAPLPPGLSFNNATGQITGTPTTTFPATTYTITAYNITGSGSTTVTLSCVNSYDWVGVTSTDWNTATNWLSGVVPTATSQAVIGVNRTFNYFPNVLASVGTVNVGSIAFGNLGGQAPGVVVNTGSTLNVSGAITYQSDANSGLGYICTLSGAGTLNAGSISIIANTVLSASYSHTFSSSVANLNVTGNIALTSSNSSSKLFNSTFKLTAGTATVSGIFQSTNTAASTSTFTVVPASTATLQLANTATLSGLSATGTNAIKFNNTGTIISYAGAAQTVYTDAGITGLAGGVGYNSIVFCGTGIKTALSGNLNIAGDFANTLANDASNYVDLSGPSVNFNGTTQNLAGGAGNGTTFYNVTFNGAGTKTMSSGLFNVASSGVLTMIGTNSNTVLAAGGLLTLNSDATGSASVAAINGPKITGNVNVQRYITGGYGYRNYRLASSPVNVATVASNNVFSINYLTNSIWLTGKAGGGFDKVGNPTLYVYREDNTPSNVNFTVGSWWGIDAINKTPAYNYDASGQGGSGSFYLPVGNGFLFFFRGNKAAAPLAVETQTSFNTAPTVTQITTGNLNQGQVTVHIYYTASSPYLNYTGSGAGTNSTVRGFNCVGNPYASSIDWEQFNTSSTTSGIYGTSNVSQTIYEFDPATGNFDMYRQGGASTNHGRRVIVSGEGFFVATSNSTQPQLIFNESAKFTAQNTGLDLFMATKDDMANLNSTSIEPYLRLQMAMDSINTDDTYIGFNSGTKTQYDFKEDGVYRVGAGKVSLGSFTSDNVLMGINRMPFPGLNGSVIPLRVSARPGTYKLNLTEQLAIPQIFDIWLKDSYKKDSVDIRKNPSYTFDVTTDTDSYGSKRFELVMRQDTALGIHLLNFTAVKAQGGSQVSWLTKYEENYTHFTVERSTDNGATFQVLGGFASNDDGNYSFVDKKPVVPNDTYRLRIEDLNGTISYSKLVTLMYNNNDAFAKNDILLYPNPATKVINVTINPAVGSIPQYSIEIANSAGKVIKTATTTQKLWQTDISNLLPGAYILRVTNSADNGLIGRGTFIKL